MKLGWLLVSISLLIFAFPIAVFIIGWTVPLGKLGYWGNDFLLIFMALFNNAFLFEWSYTAILLLTAIAILFFGIRRIKQHRNRSNA